MNALTQIEKSLVEDTIERFDAGRLIRYWPAVNGIENSNYFVRTSHAEYVLTIVEQPPAAGTAYLPLLEGLEDAGLPVPTPLRARDGRTWIDVAGKPALLQPRLPGSHVTRATPAQLGAVGRFVARMHLCSQRHGFGMPNYPRDTGWIDEHSNFASSRIAFSEAQLLQDATRRVSNALNRKDVLALPQGVIHGDLFRDNVLFQDDSLAGVLDFHHASRGYWLFDVAVVANDWCSGADGRLEQERCLALLRGYNEVRTMTQEERWFFSVFSLYAGLVFWLSRLRASLQEAHGGNVRLKEPAEFQAIVRERLEHPYHLDELLLVTSSR